MFQFSSMSRHAALLEWLLLFGVIQQATGNIDPKHIVAQVFTTVSWTWILGVTIAIFASFMSTFGINLQKYSHMQNLRLPEVLQKPYYQQFLWCCGMCLLAASAICDFVALAFVAQSLIAPLGSFSLTANILVAPCFLKETITRHDLIATAVTTLGCFVAVAASNHSETSYNFNQLVDFFLTVPYLLFFFSSVAFMYGSNRFIESIEFDPAWDHVRHKYQAFLWPVIGGTAGSFSVTFAKAFVELIKSTIYGDNEFFSLGPYIIVMFLVFFSMVQVHYLNKGLEHYKALQVIPVYQTCWILGCAAGGVVYFQEFKGFGLKDGLMFIGGLAMTLFGVVLLSNRATEEMEYDPLTNEDEHDLWLQSRKALKHKHARKTDPYILPDNSLIDSDDDMI